MSFISRLWNCLFSSPSVPSRSLNPRPFIDFPGNMVLPPPDSVKQCLMYCFFYTSNHGDKSLLQKILDERLNFPNNSEYRYEAFAADIMVTFADTKEVRSIPQSDLGYVPESEILFWIPTIEKVKKGGEWVTNRFVYFVPYAVVDNIYACLSGREIYGFPKSIGKFTIPTDPANATTFISSTKGYKVYGPNQPLKDYQFVNINRQEDDNITNPTTHFSDSKHAFSVLKDILLVAEDIWKDMSFRFCLHEIEDMLDMRLWWVFLNQYRAIDSSTNASFQAINEGQVPIEKFHGGGILHHDFELEINGLASMPVGKELGIKSGQKSRAAIWLNLDFKVALGKELWKG